MFSSSKAKVKESIDSEENYDEGFDAAGKDDGLDEMAKLRQAMDKEKAKAIKFNNNNVFPQRLDNK